MQFKVGTYANKFAFERIPAYSEEGLFVKLNSWQEDNPTCFVRNVNFKYVDDVSEKYVAIILYTKP